MTTVGATRKSALTGPTSSMATATSSKDLSASHSLQFKTNSISKIVLELKQCRHHLVRQTISFQVERSLTLALTTTNSRHRTQTTCNSSHLRPHKTSSLVTKQTTHSPLKGLEAKTTRHSLGLSPPTSPPVRRKTCSSHRPLSILKPIKMPSNQFSLASKHLPSKLHHRPSSKVSANNHRLRYLISAKLSLSLCSASTVKHSLLLANRSQCLVRLTLRINYNNH